MKYGEDVKVPEILYKYRDWYNELHREILLNQELYLAKPSTFGDIENTRECNLPTDYSDVNKTNLYRHFYKIADRDHPDWSKKEKEKYANHWSVNTPLHDVNHRSRCEKEFINDLDEVLGVLSLSALWDNKNLWSVFANSGKGICVGFDGEKLFGDYEHFGTGGPVQYYKPEDTPQLTPFLLTSEDRIQQMLKVIFSLPIKYKPEEEYRISKLYVKNRKVKVSKDVIREVILGFNISETDKQTIVLFLKTNLPAVNIYSIEIDSNGKITRKSIE